MIVSHQKKSPAVKVGLFLFWLIFANYIYLKPAKSDREEVLPPPPLLRTGLETFTSSGSSTDKPNFAFSQSCSQPRTKTLTILTGRVGHP